MTSRSQDIVSLFSEAEKGYDDERREPHFSRDLRQGRYGIKLPVGRLNSLEHGYFYPYSTLEYENGLIRLIERVKNALTDRELIYAVASPHGNLLRMTPIQNFADLHFISQNDWETLFVRYTDFIKFLSASRGR